MTLSQVLLYIYPDLVFGPGAPVQLVDDNDGQGLHIASWNDPRPQPTPAEIAAAMLPATKAQRIEADRQECQRRIYQYWPLQEQITALAGNYEPGGLGSLTAWQAANIAASNVARDTINLPATDTVAKVEAVPVAWPVWNG